MIEESLLKSHFIGKDGFRWWIGQIPPVEAWDGQANKKGWGNRYKVRILGYHPYNKAELSDNDLPWAGVIIPPTAGTGAANYAQSVRIKPGDVVIGFFLDGDNGQLPMILGSFGRTNEVSQNAPSDTFSPFTGYTSRVPPPEGTLKSGESNESTEDSQESPVTRKTKSGDGKITISSTLGLTEVPADSCGDNFVGQVSATLDNLLNNVGQATDLMEDVATVTKKIQGLSNTAVTTMMSSLYTQMVPSLQQGLQVLYDKVLLVTQNPLMAIAAQKSQVKGVQRLQGDLNCASGKIVAGLGGAVRSLVEDAVMEVVNTGTCITEQFAGSLLNGITDQISSELSNSLSGVQKILPTAFKVEDFLKSSSDTFTSIGGFFDCNQSTDNCVGQVKKWSLGYGANNSFDIQSTYSNVLDNMNIASSLGNNVAISPFQKPDCAKPSSCGAPKVQIFGGDGFGGAAKAILGSFVDNTEGLSNITSSLSRTASIIGVEITDPGSRYFSAPPVIAFTDPCNLGYGAIARAKVDYNPDSSTYGQITSITMVTEGENYPIASSEEEAINSDEVPIGVIDTQIIISGDNYENDTTTAISITPNGNIEYNLSIENGKIVNIKPINSIKLDELPNIVIKSSTGSGALIKPILGRLPLSPQGDILEIIDCVK